MANIPRNRLSIAALTAALFFGAFLVDFGESTRLWELLGDALHVPIFAATAFGLCWFFERFAMAPLWCALGSSALVIFIELVQPTFGRSASPIDMKNGFIGIACGIAATFLWRRYAMRAAIPAAVVLVAGMAVALLPAYGEWRLLERRPSSLPVLADFERSDDTEWFAPLSEREPVETTFLTSLLPHSGHGALKVNSVPMRYSGVELRLEAMSWESYDNLELAVYVEEPAVFSLRIDDWLDCSSFDSRFNRNFELTAGWNELKVPLEDVRRGPKRRLLNTAALKRILFFLGPAQQSQSFLLDDIKLS